MERLHIELDRLAAAERLIAENDERISTQESVIEILTAQGDDSAEAEEFLRVLRELREQLHVHRRLILERIEALRANNP